MFKLKILFPIAASILLTNIEPSSSQPKNNFSKINFSCVNDSGLPTTIARNTSTDKILPIIRWKSEYFSNSGYDSATRCQIVSERFQKAYTQGSLNYITAGTVNKLPVICATATKSPCDNNNILFTLEPKDDPNKVLQQLFDVRYHSATPLVRGGKKTKYPYINVDQIIAPLDENKEPNNSTINNQEPVKPPANNLHNDKNPSETNSNFF